MQLLAVARSFLSYSARWRWNRIRVVVDGVEDVEPFRKLAYVLVGDAVSAQGGDDLPNYSQDGSSFHPERRMGAVQRVFDLA